MSKFDLGGEVAAVLRKLANDIEEWPSRRDAEINRTRHYVTPPDKDRRDEWDANVYEGMLYWARQEILRLRDEELPWHRRQEFKAQVAQAHQQHGLNPESVVEAWASKQPWYNRERTPRALLAGQLIYSATPRKGDQVDERGLIVHP